MTGISGDELVERVLALVEQRLCICWYPTTNREEFRNLLATEVEASGLTALREELERLRAWKDGPDGVKWHVERTKKLSDENAALREDVDRLRGRVSDEGGKIVRAFVAGWFENLGDMEPAEYQKHREKACGAAVRYLRNLDAPEPSERET